MRAKMPNERYTSNTMRLIRKSFAVFVFSYYLDDCPAPAQAAPVPPGPTSPRPEARCESSTVSSAPLSREQWMSSEELTYASDNSPDMSA
ncbi:hypothetical protein BGZ63DRAFT_451457 [Mariannaea sp. PMI_226]|nr:hypothetical protein BGZ63DRAFT_451457 [Mariannaea sp. PMI_226]